MNQVQIFKQGKRIRYSKNLRGLLKYGFSVGVRRVSLHDNAALVLFKDGASCVVKFASEKVMERFFVSRSPKWGGVVVWFSGENHGSGK